MCQTDAARDIVRFLSAWPRIPWDLPSEKLCPTHKDQQDSADAGGQCTRRCLLRREHAPSYLTTNPYTLGGFRRVETLKEAVMGLFYLHNAWLDTWTSVFSLVHGTILFLIAIFYLDVFNKYGNGAGCVFIIFYAVVLVHAPASIACHLIGNSGISKEVHELTLELDYFCIITSSMLLGFTQSSWVFSTAGTLTVSAIAAGFWMYLVTHLRYVISDHVRRLTMLLGIGHLYLVPQWYQGICDLWLLPSSSLPVTLQLAAATHLCLFVGGMLYATHVPERFWPGKFDIWFGSHSWMHVMINGAHLCEWLFLVHMLDRRLSSEGM